MQADILSSFIAFKLTPEEEVQAYNYNDLQLAGIQNLVAAAAEEILQVTLEVNQLDLDAQKKLAYTKGQLDILKTLLARSDVIKEQLENSKQQN